MTMTAALCQFKDVPCSTTGTTGKKMLCSLENEEIQGGDSLVAENRKRDFQEEIRAVFNLLGPPPSLDAVRRAEEAIAQAETRLEKEIEELKCLPIPEGVDPDQHTAFLWMKEDVLRREIGLQIRDHVELLDLHQKLSSCMRVLQEVTQRARVGDGLFECHGGESDDVIGLKAFPRALSLSINASSPDSTLYTADSPMSSCSDTRTWASELRSPNLFSDGAMASTSSHNLSRPRRSIPLRRMSTMAAYTKPWHGSSSSMEHYHFKQRSNLQNVNSSALDMILEDPSPCIEVSEELLRLIEASAADGRTILDLKASSFPSPLEYIPVTLGALDSLRELNLANNILVELPETLGNLTGLTLLDISCNKILELPETIGNMESLEVLKAQHNLLTEVPSSLGNCKALRELNLGFNSLTRFPGSIGNLNNLEKLCVPLNKLESLPTTIGQLSSLVEVDIHFNALTSLPKSIGKLRKLRKLNVSANHSDLRELPESLGELECLEELDISQNQIKVLPTSVLQLSNLKKLNAEGNPWVFPPMQVVDRGLEAIFEYMEDFQEQQELRKKNEARGLLTRFLSTMPLKSAGERQRLIPKLWSRQSL